MMRVMMVGLAVAMVAGAGIGSAEEAPPRRILIQGGPGQVPAVKGEFKAWAGTWVLVSFGAGDTAEAVPAPVKVTFALTEDGTVSGRGGCNTYGGQAMNVPDRADGIRFGPMFMTMMACEDPAMQVEQRYHAALTRMERGALDRGVLTLSSADGAVVLVFRKE